jgi:hypothetical protein
MGREDVTGRWEEGMGKGRWEEKMLKVDRKRGRQIGGAGKGGETEERMERGRWEEIHGQSI